uniref:Reverse transcriptase domain-containing protein n=1 Tax=Tanacetum cinerariifolium TaxID=118510 RepID=A0A699H2T8_TANCI|nr:hypothetical protein [Tanacetum cinerariifolium]
MTELFRLLKELTASQTSKKVLVREETRHPTTKNVNSISLIRMEEEKSVEKNRATDKSVTEPIEYDEQEPPKEVDKTNEGGRKVDDKPAKSARENVTKNEEEEPAGFSSPHMTYDLLPSGHVHDAILKKKITWMEDIRGNFEIPCNVRGLKDMNARVDQGSDVNTMPLSIYKRLTDERPAEMDIRRSLASHSYIYPLGTSFLTTTKAVIKFDNGTITLKSRKSKMSFHGIPEPYCRINKGIKNDIEPIAPTMTVNRLVLEWEEKIKLCQLEDEQNLQLPPKQTPRKADKN